MLQSDYVYERTGIHRDRLDQSWSLESLAAERRVACGKCSPQDFPLHIQNIAINA